MMYGSFFGWYLKCQSDTQTLAVIPAIHKTKHKKTCSIQLITDTNTWSVEFPSKDFRRIGKHIFIQNNRFGAEGIQMNITTPKLTVKGKLTFGSLTPLKYDIMGPFALIPFMECRHSVWSMRHSVHGTLHVNGTTYTFQNALGYWEGDRGWSFPKRYIWTQCSFPKGMVMLSVADIPMLGSILEFHFTGIISIVLWKGKEYRLATYLGAKVIKIGRNTVRIAQRNLELEAQLLEESKHPLKAPTNGNMVRTIHESAACKAYYRFRKDGNTLFEFETDKASFEFEF